MKRFQLSLVAVVLTLAITGSAFAGDIQCPVARPAPPSVAGEIQTPVVSSADTVTEIAFGLVQSVLSLF